MRWITPRGLGNRPPAGELPITIEDTLITVGCESLTLAEWEAWALERYPILHQLRGAIVALARSHHQGGVRK